MSVQFIEQHGKKQFAVIPVDTYAVLLEKAEMLDDIKAYDDAMVSDEELIPGDVVDRLVNGENKIKVWREYRQLTQAGLAELSGMAQATIAQMEGGKRIGSIAALKKIATTLKLDVDDLV
jgi:DNA-binding XRE family transcriptional regulator